VEIRIASLLSGAREAEGTVVIIDVFRAFSTAAVALSRGARQVLMVDSLEQALALRDAGAGDACVGERHGAKPPRFDFGNSPAELSRADVSGKTLIQTTTNGTAGLNAAKHADRLFAGSLVTAEATVQAILADTPAVVTLVAMGRGGKARADEDELCALYLRSRLEGREPDIAALRNVLSGMAPPPDPKLVASGDYDLRDREIALMINSIPFAIEVTAENGHLIARRADPPGT
jgi:2-phosphosulfolactate phosphatase